MRVCTGCSRSEPEVRFNLNSRASDLKQPRCAECQSAWQKKYWQRTKADLVLHCKRLHDCRRWNGTEKGKARRTRYDKTAKGKAERKRYILENPQKVHARRVLNGAVRRGKIIRPDVCSKCGEAGKIEAHHEDYAFPLEVAWLCITCH